MKKLPIGIQSFRELRTGQFLYVDKTRYVYDMATRGKYYFLSRPRRFGKSLLVSTLKELYSGSKELFADLWIESHWHWEKQHPVVHVPFSILDYQNAPLDEVLALHFERIAAEYEIEVIGNSHKDKFHDLIRKLSEKQKVVLLIDEYDKPIIDYIGRDLAIAKNNQRILKTLYSTIKDSDDFFEMVFITGVSKFSRVSIFSDLNNLEDLTLHPRYATIAGYTQQELENNFSDHLAAMRESDGMNEKALLDKIRLWYNGYSWDNQTKVYNPFSILLLFSSGVFQNHWFKTATPTFLIDLLKERPLYDFEKVQVSQAVFDSYEIERNLDIHSLLFQTGYLTIDGVDEFGIYTLTYPNKEVRDSFVEYLIGGYGHSTPSSVAPRIVQMRRHLCRMIWLR